MSERNRSASATLGGPAPLDAGTWWCPDRDETMPQPAADTGNTKSMDQPFTVPDFVGAQFAVLRGYWNSLRRGNADMPFADDFSLAALGKMSANCTLLHVFQNPQRFRFDLAGAHVAQAYGTELENRFVDEVSPRAPLDCLAAQCATTVESAAPTLYNHPRTAASADYRRLMLPLWGDGRVNTILAVFDIQRASDVA
jgi:hypothetical protein